MFNQFLINEKNKTHIGNIEQKNSYETNNKQNQNDFKSQPWQTKMPQTYNNIPYYNTPYWIISLTHYNQQYFPQTPIDNNTQQTNQPTFKNKFPTTQRKKCSICSKTNHSEEKCFFKDITLTAMCTLFCTRQNCRSYIGIFLYVCQNLKRKFFITNVL
jgi:hypothetical protein